MVKRRNHLNMLIWYDGEMVQLFFGLIFYYDMMQWYFMVMVETVQVFLI